MEITGSDFVPTSSQNGAANSAIAIPPPIIRGRRPTRSESQPQSGTPKTDTAAAMVIAMTATFAGIPNCWVVYAGR